jgi:hypothetical protein
MISGFKAFPPANVRSISSISSLGSISSSLSQGEQPSARRPPFRDASTRLNGLVPSKLAATVHHNENIPPPEDSSDALGDQSGCLDRLGDPLDPLDCYEFDTEVYKFMQSAELVNLPSPDLFSRQLNITPRMRATVVDWLVEVHRKLKMHTDTLFLTVTLIDQYLTSASIDKSKFQRLACAALLLAAKNGELQPPTLQDLADVADNSFTVVALSRMEALLFAAVDFHVDPILSSHFIKRFLRLANPDARLSMLAHYINETALLDSEFIGLVPSFMAAAVVCLTLALERGPGQWTTYMESNTGYKLEQITDVTQKLLLAVGASATGRFQAIRKKYASPATLRVSAVQFPETIRLI